MSSAGLLQEKDGKMLEESVLDVSSQRYRDAIKLMRRQESDMMQGFSIERYPRYMSGYVNEVEKASKVGKQPKSVTEADIEEVDLWDMIFTISLCAPLKRSFKEIKTSRENVLVGKSTRGKRKLAPGQTPCVITSITESSTGTYTIKHQPLRPVPCDKLTSKSCEEHFMCRRRDVMFETADYGCHDFTIGDELSGVLIGYLTGKFKKLVEDWEVDSDSTNSKIKKHIVKTLAEEEGSTSIDDLMAKLMKLDGTTLENYAMAYLCEKAHKLDLDGQKKTIRLFENFFSGSSFEDVNGISFFMHLKKVLTFHFTNKYLYGNQLVDVTKNSMKYAYDIQHKDPEEIDESEMYSKDNASYYDLDMRLWEARYMVQKEGQAGNEQNKKDILYDFYRMGKTRYRIHNDIYSRVGDETTSKKTKAMMLEAMSTEKVKVLLDTVYRKGKMFFITGKYSRGAQCVDHVGTGLEEAEEFPNVYAMSDESPAWTIETVVPTVLYHNLKKLQKVMKVNSDEKKELFNDKVNEYCVKYEVGDVVKAVIPHKEFREFIPIEVDILSTFTDPSDMDGSTSPSIVSGTASSTDMDASSDGVDFPSASSDEVDLSELDNLFDGV